MTIVNTRTGRFVIVMILLSLGALFPSYGQANLLICELGIEFETGSAYLNREMQDDLATKCVPGLSALREDDRVLVRGYTNHQEWPSGNNFGLDTDSTRFFVNESSERILSEQRAFNAYSFLVNEPSIALGTERVFYTGTAGENLKTVRVFLVPQGTQVQSVSDILDAIEEVRSNTDGLRELVTTARDSSASAAQYSREARDASRSAEEWSKKTYELVTQLKPPRWFIKTGIRTSSQFGEGFMVALGREFLDQDLDVYIEAYTQERSHRQDLLWRPGPDPTSHWGTWNSAMLVVRPNLRQVGDHVFVFLEGGFGAVHAAYRGPQTSIGWHHTGFLSALRAGIEARTRRLGAELVVGQEMWNFPKSSVLPEINDNDFHVSAQASVQITYHF